MIRREKMYQLPMFLVSVVLWVLSGCSGATDGDIDTDIDLALPDDFRQRDG